MSVVCSQLRAGECDKPCFLLSKRQSDPGPRMRTAGVTKEPLLRGAGIFRFPAPRGRTHPALNPVFPTWPRDLGCATGLHFQRDCIQIPAARGSVRSARGDKDRADWKSADRFRGARFRKVPVTFLHCPLERENSGVVCPIGIPVRDPRVLYSCDLFGAWAKVGWPGENQIRNRSINQRARSFSSGPGPLLARKKRKSC